MSLLMDALKKAEQDKKEAAKRLKDEQNQNQSSDDITLTQESSTEDDLITQRATELELPDENQTRLDENTGVEGLTLSPVDRQEPIIEDDDSSTQDSSLSDLSESTPHTPVSELSIADEDSVAEEPVPEISPEGDLTLVPTTTDLQVDEPTVAPTEDTVQGEQELNDSDSIAKVVDDEYFSATVSAVQLAQDIGVDSPTPVAAQTVFTAISTKPDNQVLQWGAFIVLCLVIAVSLSFFVFNYTVPVERSIKSPLVAKDIESQSEPMPVIEIPDELVSSTEVDSSLFVSNVTEVIEKENETVVQEGQAESEATSDTVINPEIVSGNITGSEPAEEMVNEKAIDPLAMSQEKIWYPAEDNVSDEYTPVAEAVDKTTLVLPEQIMLEPKLIKISRSVSTDKSSALINKAYQEYLAGDYDAAEKSYRSILEKLPENRDSLLGLAAISIHKGNIRQAYEKYLEILRLYPGDSVAEAALINFKRNGDYVKNESILKTFIQREPDNSFLYYSLGHLHAAQKRWPEAQQSFFNAYKIETSNPNYAFNLAVSLDHIGQRQSALDYYNVALKLSDNSTAGFTSGNFDRTVVLSRINALSSLVDLQ